jgi:membrane protein DedA with SNARE-associated domain/membrane-associated phospholipid phosphatase
MPTSLDQLLPSLHALGLWSYWIIGLAALLEAFLVTGMFIPGTLIVIAGGMLVQQGILDFFDLAWFVAIGSFLGGEASYWVGVFARKGLERRWHPETSPAYQRAEGLFRRHGGFALILGRFLGPLAGFVSFAATVSGMPRRKFLIWNIASGFPFALILIALGLFLGDVITRLGPVATRMALFAGAAVLGLAVLWWLVVRIVRTLPFLLSVLRSIVAAVAENPDVRAWGKRHPRSAWFIRSRFDRSHFGGLSATFLGVIAAYIGLIWAGSAADVLMADPIMATDLRLANLVHAFWSPGLLQFFAKTTALGDWRTVGLIFLAALCVLQARARTDLALGLTVALVGNVVSVSLLKTAFHRPRPDLAYFVETSGSFPSGHAAISVAFFAMLIYLAWRLKWLRPVMAVFIAASLALLIGLSRIYLIEHYLSDVLNGWLLGGLWMVIGIAVTEWWREAHPATAPLKGTRATRLAWLAALAFLAGAGWIVATYDKPRNHSEFLSRSETVAAPAQIFSTGKAPFSTESIGGTALEPINVIVVAKNLADLETAMGQAGWVQARKPGLASLSQAAWAALTNRPDDNAPVTPYFWYGVPNKVSFQRPTKDNSLRKRHHVRFWQTRFLTPEGNRIFVGAASFDDGFDRTLLHHIDPNIDAERDILAKDLQQAGLSVRVEFLQVSPPHMGESVAGDPWFTDGKAAIVEIVP